MMVKPAHEELRSGPRHDARDEGRPFDPEGHAPLYVYII